MENKVTNLFTLMAYAAIEDMRANTGVDRFPKDAFNNFEALQAVKTTKRKKEGEAAPEGDKKKPKTNIYVFTQGAKSMLFEICTRFIQELADCQLTPTDSLETALEKIPEITSESIVSMLDTVRKNRFDKTGINLRAAEESSGFVREYIKQKVTGLIALPSKGEFTDLFDQSFKVLASMFAKYAWNTGKLTVTAGDITAMLDLCDCDADTVEVLRDTIAPKVVKPKTPKTPKVQSAVVDENEDDEDDDEEEDEVADAVNNS